MKLDDNLAIHGRHPIFLVACHLMPPSLSIALRACVVRSHPPRLALTCACHGADAPVPEQVPPRVVDCIVGTCSHAVIVIL